MQTMQVTLQYPEQLPLALFIGRSYKTVDPLERSNLVTGRARQRRAYTSTPTMVEVRWIFNREESQVFEAFFRWALSDGTRWFRMPLRMPDGLLPRVVRFTGIYSGPDEEGPSHWRFSAQLEIRDRQTLPEGWELLPDYVLMSDIFDRAMNAQWPLSKYQIYPDVFDRAVNEQWPLED